MASYIRVIGAFASYIGFIGNIGGLPGLNLSTITSKIMAKSTINKKVISESYDNPFWFIPKFYLSRVLLL
jgi:hypothetical protein